MYLLVTIFTQFSPHNLWALSLTGPAEVSVEFAQLNGIKLGAPVLADGQLVGTVSEISALASDAAQTGLRPISGGTSSSIGYRVDVKISPRYRGLLRKGTIALIKSPISAARVEPETVVELLIPSRPEAPILKQGDRIVGYSSFQEFWSADLTKRGVEPALFGS